MKAIVKHEPRYIRGAKMNWSVRCQTCVGFRAKCAGLGSMHASITSFHDPIDDPDLKNE